MSGCVGHGCGSSGAASMLPRLYYHLGSDLSTSRYLFIFQNFVNVGLRSVFSELALDNFFKVCMVHQSPATGYHFSGRKFKFIMRHNYIYMLVLEKLISIIFFFKSFPYLITLMRLMLILLIYNNLFLFKSWLSF